MRDWQTAAPLGTDRMQEHRRAIHALEEKLMAGHVLGEPNIHIKSMEIWIDGVLWERDEFETYR